MKKLLCLLLFIICTFVGCSCNLGEYRYHISVVREGFSIREEWYAANRTYGAYYKGEYLEEEERWSTLVDETSPKTQTYLILNQEELNGGFSKFPNVDFENQMVVVHFYTDIYNRKQKIDYAKFNEGILNIYFSIRSNNGRGDASMPSTHTLILIMDKLSVEEINITYKE